MSRRERQDGGEGGEDEMSDVEDCRFWWCCRINYPGGGGGGGVEKSS